MKNGKKTSAKTPKQFERYFKGVSNHRRVKIIQLIERRRGITVDEIAESCDGNFKTISEHLRKLVIAGLVNKKYCGRRVCHELSPYGQKFTEFMRTFTSKTDQGGKLNTK